MRSSFHVILVVLLLGACRSAVASGIAVASPEPVQDPTQDPTHVPAEGEREQDDAVTMPSPVPYWLDDEPRDPAGGSGKPTLRERFTDPTDGAFDASAFLLSRTGFLPVPIIITEPAIGVGGGLATLFFHGPKVRPDDPWSEEALENFTPSISALFGGGTENGTWFAGGAHMRSWRDDSARTLSVLGGASANLDFYVSDMAFAYNVDAAFLMQDAKFRVGGSPLFLGGAFTYADTNVKFRGGVLPPGVDPTTNITTAGAAALAYWDTRDNILNPTRGQEAEAEFTYFGPEFGGTNQYTELELTAKSWHPVGDFILGGRVRGATANGDVPFYALPAVHLRGVPAVRYQGEYAGAFEAELRYLVTPRWRLVAFGGLGAAKSRHLPDSGEIYAGGVGFRYLTARLLGLSTGLDLAWGPEDTVIYITGGSGL